MSRYKAYEAYKKIDSKWVSEIPNHWQPIALKRIVLSIKDGTHGTFARTSDGFPILSAKNVQSHGIDISESESMISEKDHYEITKNGYPKKGDLLITCVGTIGRTCVYEFDQTFSFQRSVAFLRLSKIAVPKFYKYFVESKTYQSQLEAQSKASAQSGVYMGDLVNTTTVLPSYEEQKVIANFLDHETAKIDTLIAKQQELIKLLKEKRQAVISHAVTKGINPNAPMRDSGIEWLGEVPAHWVVKPLKFAISDRRGAVKAGPFGSHLKNSDMEGTDVKVITQKNVISKNFEIGDSMISKEKYRELEVFTIDRNDVLVTTRGTIGKSVVYKSNEVAILHPCLIRLQVDEQQVFPDFISLVIEESGYAIEQILVSSNSTTIEVIYSENLINTTVCLPSSLEEQGQILAEIAVQREHFENLIQKAEQAIFLSQERRTALISAAVTGKIDVRDWQPPSESAIAA